MAWNDDDDLGGEDALSARQRAAVDRLRARQGRYQRERPPLTNAQQWADFNTVEQATENERFRRS